VSDYDDIDLHEPGTLGPTLEPRPPERSLLRFVLPVALILIVIVTGYLLMQRQEVASTIPVPQQAATATPAASTTAPAPPAITLPPLDQSDALVGQMVRMLSMHPSVIAWLMTKGLIRNAAVVTVAIADGGTPAAQLRPLKPAGRFAVTESRLNPAVDPRSYQRYDMLTAAVASVDPAAAARTYATLKPLLDAAHRDLGYPDTPFDRTLERAIGRLLATPVTAERVPLRVRGGVFVYADDRLEQLTAAQKQLLRFGPRNVERIQAALRGFAMAAGLNPSVTQ
jgi:hypothetical protein